MVAIQCHRCGNKISNIYDFGSNGGGYDREAKVSDSLKNRHRNRFEIMGAVLFSVIALIAAVLLIPDHYAKADIYFFSWYFLNRDYAEKFPSQEFNLNLIGIADRKATWQSSNEKVATVSNNGHVSCIKVGEATITATYKGVVYSCDVKVVKPYISCKEKVCEVGDKFYVKLKGLKAASYEIQDETVATVNEKGKVRTKRAGKTKLVAVAENGKRFKCVIKVYDTARWKDRSTIPSENCKVTSKIKAKDVPSKSFSVQPGHL